MAMRPGVMNRYKPSSEAEQSYAADLALAGRHAELLEAAGAAETEFRQAQAGRAPDAELRRLALALDSALTDAMRAAWAVQRAAIGVRGYDDRISRPKPKPKPPPPPPPAAAEPLPPLRKTHRVNDIPAVTFEPSPPIA